MLLLQLPKTGLYASTNLNAPWRVQPAAYSRASSKSSQTTVVSCTPPIRKYLRRRESPVTAKGHRELRSVIDPLKTWGEEHVLDETGMKR